MEVCVFSLYICMKAREFYTEYIILYCPVAKCPPCTSYFPQLTVQQPQRRRQNGFKPNGEAPSEVTSTSFLKKDPALLFFPPSKFSPIWSVKTKTKFSFYWVPYLFWRLIVLGFAVSSPTFSMLNLLSQKQKTNCQHTFSGISLRKKTKEKNRQKENKSILLSCIYESICLNIEKRRCIC